ncbi:MAG: hypothetical protein PHW18_09070 [Sulfuricurvum sp.]|uniref:DUF3226 domain-containing protein n=1 Tax=Sulfuricurvum sp. TaxID=2025608 RepID=UPI00262FE516|nr:DUF3226 domain-containing protein [Sulfuricurvum sp.]MDD2829710.1 hypothetical protein [Sulfuricurvum sp.]MDD4950152.1 hypothetical protein [Sulfuricurvum sp.]
MSNLLIVESHNDKYFIEALSESLKIDIKINQPICKIDDYECLNGLSEKKLFECLDEVKFDDYTKIGIILDADKEGIENRLALIDSVVKQFDDTIEIKNINTPIRSDKLNIEFVCYITNIDGYGELETLLKTIKTEDSTFADCLSAWKDCLIASGKKISDKDFDKFWVNNYLRYDTCTKKEQTQADRKCKNEIAIKKPIWNFEHKALTDLKAFLQLF